MRKHISKKKVNVIKGDLIKLANNGNFDAIMHGCNCFSTMGAGIALQMKLAYSADKLPLEIQPIAHPILKLGNIDYKQVEIASGEFTLINAYTQYQPGPDFNFTAFEVICQKVNLAFKGKHIGLPMIGSGIGGGNWSWIKSVIEHYCTDVKVTIVEYQS